MKRRKELEKVENLTNTTNKTKLKKILQVEFVCEAIQAQSTEHLSDLFYLQKIKNISFFKS